MVEKTVTTIDPMEEWAREIVYAWIREDATTGIKLMMTPEISDKLIKRIAENAS